MRVRQVLPRDAIPSVDDPTFAPDHEGDPTDEVIVLPSASAPRAYPVRFLHYHEIVNDRVAIESRDGGGREERPVAVTWCPLCGSAVVYDAVVDGRELTFGVSGKLADDDLVMYDRETESEWKQSRGECITGAFEGTVLDVLPAGMSTWERFRERYPDAVVLQPPGGKSEVSGPGDEPREVEYDADPYDDYFEAEGFGLGAHRGQGGRDGEREDIDPKEVVAGIEAGDEAIGVPLRAVEEAGGALELAVGGRDVVVFAGGGGLHAFENPGHEFEPVGDGSFRADGTTWDGETGEAADGRELDRVPIRRLFAFAWQDDHGPGAFYGLD
ncbi:MAG: DUF3179 domain-containing protein [Halobacteriales archaeon]